MSWFLFFIILGILEICWKLGSSLVPGPVPYLSWFFNTKLKSLNFSS